MTIKYTDKQIEKAVDNLIDGWDMDTLVNFAYDDRLHYFLHHADQEEIKILEQEINHFERVFKSMDQDGGRYNTTVSVLKERLEQIKEGKQI